MKESPIVYVVGALGCYPDVKEIPVYVLNSPAFSTPKLALDAIKFLKPGNYALFAYSRELWTGDVDRLVVDGKVIDWRKA